MDIEINSPSGKTYNIQWNGEKPPTDEDIAEIHAQLEPKPFVDLKKAASNVTSDIKNLTVGPFIAGKQIGEDVAKAFEENQSIMAPGKGIVEAAKAGVIEPAKAFGKGVADMFLHPVQSFENAPISTALMAGGIGESGFNVLKQGAKMLKKPMTASEAVTKGGGVPIGEKSGLVWFNDPKTQSTIVMAPEEVTPKSVSKAIAEKQKQFEPKDMIDTAEVLPTSLEKTNVQNIATNQYVRDNTKNFIGKQAPELSKEAADLTKQVKPAIRKAQNDFYQKLGIKDSDPIDANLALAKMQYTIEQASKYLDESHIKKAKAVFDDLVDKSVKTEKVPISDNVPANENQYFSEGTIPEMQNKVVGFTEKHSIQPLTFGKVKNATSTLYDLAEDNVNDLGRKTMAGKFYTDLGNALTEAKRNDPRIASAGQKYSDLMDAERLINKTLRLNREMGEMRLESRIASSWKDQGQLTFKENLQKLHDILSKYDETKGLVGYGGFTDKIKLAQLANDIKSKKTVTPIGMGRIPGVKMVGNLVKVGDPNFQAKVLAGGINKGFINPAAVAGKSVNYPDMIIGPARTRFQAIRDILQK